MDGEAEHGATRPAGALGPWLAAFDRALLGETDADVPCDGCTACCSSSQFVHVGPEEHDALAHIPGALLFPAPGLPAGHVLLGYDQQGRCPMLVDGACSIYEHRPRTCRTYDCRVFPASGLVLDTDDKQLISARSREWRFDVATEGDEVEHAAVRAAAAFVRDRGHELPAEVRPPTTTQRAVAAVALRRLFVGPAGTSVVPSPAEVAVALRRRRPTT